MSKKDIFYKIAKWNEIRGTLDSYDDKNEIKMLLEECLEFIATDKDDIKTVVKDILSMVKFDNYDLKSQLDACYDLIYIAIGTASKIIKCGNECINRCFQLNKPNLSIDDIALIIKVGLNRVIEANDKKGLERNEQGKIIKSKDFVEPVIPLTLDDLTIEERDGSCKCKEERDDAGEII